LISGDSFPFDDWLVGDFSFLEWWWSCVDGAVSAGLDGGGVALLRFWNFFVFQNHVAGFQGYFPVLLVVGELADEVVEAGNFSQHGVPLLHFFDEG
jgi:hypothetical protein